MFVQGVANFLDDLMGGLQLAGLCVLIGGLAWGLGVLQAWRDAPGAPLAALRRCIVVLRAGAWLLAAAQALKFLAKLAVLAATLGEVPLATYAATVQFRAGVVRLVLAVAVALAASRLAAAPASRRRWALILVLAAPLAASGAWRVHAVGRFDSRALLMSLTVVHQLAAAVWVGAVIQLFALWRLALVDPEVRRLWPVVVARFSPLGVASVSVLAASGIVLAWYYVGSWEGMLGTGYGSLATAKVLLLALTLGFAGLNFRAGRRWLRDPGAATVVTRVPYYIEAEALLLASIVFVAATLSSQPPAVDIPALTASLAEVLDMFAPKAPRLTSPTHEALLAGEAGRLAVIGRVPSSAATEWSDYNHNVAGVFLLGMGVIALASYVRGWTWARYWPAGFVGLAIFLFFRSDAESWPLGPIGFWQSTLGNGEVLQHRLATLLAFALGIVEMRARTTGTGERLPYVFPVLCALGGVLLVTHAHVPFEIKTDYLIQSTHLVMGLLAVVMATGRWLELRLGHAGATTQSRAAGLVAVGAMLMIGAVLLFYREPLY